jgi:peptidoglycan/LPS O-acetylase OafA/YrhL
VISFLKANIVLTKWVSFPFKTLGDISYTLYLLHPLVYYTLLKYSLLPANKEFSFILCIIITLLFSVIIYNLIEKPFMKLGRK